MILDRMDRVAVAFSGGVDSAFLLRIAREVLGENVIALTADSVIHPSSEREETESVAAAIGVEHIILKTDVMSMETFLSNPPDRCYHCKKEIFTQLKHWAEENGYTDIVEGSNSDDDDDYRPGMRALCELGIRSPLREAGLTKDEIRGLSREYGLPTYDKPALACLASRIPYGTRITRAILERIDKAESFLRSRGFNQVRVRDHGTVARIEVPFEDRIKMIRAETARSITDRFRAFGYRYVTLDLEGYRRGSLNETLEDHGPGSD